MNHHALSMSTNILSGVLLLENNKTYGRTPNKKRLLYKCIPDKYNPDKYNPDKYNPDKYKPNAKTFPPFLIPYEIKIEFSKKFINKYITFRFENWPETSEYPFGQIVETLGNVDDLNAFYEYQLHCKDLNISNSKLVNQTRVMFQSSSPDACIEQILQNPRYKIVDRRPEYIITIDPQHSLDFDDGFSITLHPNSTYKISVYIANVYFWLEILELWSYFSDRTSTIYLPDKRRPMLPPILADSLCSLQEKQNRFAFTMDLIVDENGQILGEPQYHNTIIRVSKNYCYEESKLLKDLQYKLLFDLTKKITTTMHHTDEIIDSHDLVAFWMVQMNKHCSEYMIRNKFGIFRSAAIWNTDKTDEGNPLIKAQQDGGNTLIKTQCTETSRMLQYWNNSSGQYVLYSDNHQELEHAIMNMKSYIHITSPIRRLVDLLNQMSMMQHLGNTELSHGASAFLLKWIQNIEYINTSTKNTRKVQTECEVLQRCTATPNIIGQIFHGIVLDQYIKPNGKITYTIYLESIKLISNITIGKTLTDLESPDETLTDEILEKHSIHRFKLFLFQDEYNSKRKIRLQLHG